MLSLLHQFAHETCHASVWLFCFGLLCFLLCLCGLVWFLFLLLACDDFVTDWTLYRSATSSLLRPLNLQAAMYALISSFTLVCNMQSNVLDDLAEAMKALDGKSSDLFGKNWRL